jgi:tetratricopeptide (TPR) repeat protein
MTESLFAVMFLLAFLAYLRSLEGSKALWMTLSCVFYVLALLSKETAIVLPALIFADAWIRYAPTESEGTRQPGSRFRGAFTFAVPFLPIAIAYLLVRYKILSGLGHSFIHVDLMTWLLTIPSILFFYVRNWVFPVHLGESYDLFYQPNLNLAHVLLPLAILIALGAALWFSRNLLGSKAVGYAVAWILIPLLPALDTFVFRPDELVHDRYFYVPSIGAALLIALVIERATATISKGELFGQPIRIVVAGLALATVLAFLAGQATRYWITDFVLFSRAHQIAPLNHTALNNLGAVLITRQEYDRAQELLETGYKMDPNDFRFSLNLGRVYYRRGDYGKAEAYMLRAKQLDPDLAETYLFLSEIQLKQGRAKDAQESLHHAVDLDPYSAPYHTGYGIVLALNGDCASAQRQFESALNLNPGDPYATIQYYRCRAALAAPPPSTKPGSL